MSSQTSPFFLWSPNVLMGPLVMPRNSMHTCKLPIALTLYTPAFLSGVQNCPELKELSACGNTIACISESLAECKKLQRLRLDGNRCSVRVDAGRGECCNRRSGGDGLIVLQQGRRKQQDSEARSFLKVPGKANKVTIAIIPILHCSHTSSACNRNRVPNGLYFRPSDQFQHQQAAVI